MLKKTLAIFIATITLMTSTQLAFAETENKDEETTISSISFQKDNRNDKELGQILTNGKTYEFPIVITDDKGKTHELKDKHLDGYKISLRAIDGKDALSSIAAEKSGTSYNLVVKPKSGWPTTQTEVSYNFVIMNRRTGKTVAEKAIDFSVGYETLNDDAYKNVGKGDLVYVTQNAPVITEEQFSAMDKLSGGKKITLSNNNWRYEVRVSDQKDLNLLNHKNPNKTVMQAFPNQEFEFFNFPAGSEFDFTGTMTLDVYDLEESFVGKFFTYRYYKGRMTKIDTNYDKEDGTISFNTKWLGNFVVTNKEIKDGTIVEEIKDAPVSDNNGETNKPSTDKPAPPTGAIA
ncbi:MAG: hypothetical protein RR048_03220 [Oscillospiraceae bacterium]